MDNLYESPSDRFIVLISRELGGNISLEEKSELEKIFISYPDFRLQADILAGMYNQDSVTRSSPFVAEAYMRHLLKYRSEFLFEDDFSGINHANNHHSVKQISGPGFIRKWGIHLAVCLLLTVIISSQLFFSKGIPTNSEKSNHINSVVTKYGNKSKISLPDGSLVWLNAGSRLDYNNADFNNNIREVNLTGEAYFDITHHAGKPFIVRSGNMRIRVLGTTFNVKAYPEEQQIETSLIKGSVEVTINDRPDDVYILRPHEKLVVTNDLVAQNKNAVKNNFSQQVSVNDKADIVALKKIDYSSMEKLVLETAWVENKLVFRAEKFSDLSVKMERWYNVKIRFRDDEKKDLKFTGIFTTETILQALKAMQVVHVFSFKREGNIIFID